MKKYKRGKKDPVFMIHRNGSGMLRLCSLTDEELQTVRKQIDMTEEDLEKIIEAANPYVLFSGGLDSICTLLYAKAIADRVNSEVKAIHVDTTVAIDGTTKYVKEICRKVGVNLKIVRPKVDFFTLAAKWGIPSHGYRWCCRELKIKPIAEYLKKKPQRRVVLDGIRAAESSVRANYLPVWYHPSFRSICASPIFYWSNIEVQSYISKFALPEKFKSLKTSPECWCGAYKSKADFRKLYKISPELFHRLAELEGRIKTDFTFLYEEGKKLPLIELKNQIIEEKK